MDDIMTIILAVISSGALVSLITHIFDRKKSEAEVEQLRQEIENHRADTQIKIDEYIKNQLINLTETHKRESEERHQEIIELQHQNDLLQKQVTSLNNQIHQVLSWISYDMLSYQRWLETELTKLNPDIELPEYRRPPKFVQEHLRTSIGDDEGHMGTID